MDTDDNAPPHRRTLLRGATHSNGDPLTRTRRPSKRPGAITGGLLLLLASTIAPAAARGAALDEQMTPALTLSADELRFFESKIRPVLIEHCYGCHSNRTTRPKAGLLLDTREGMLRGGIGGPAIVPGDANGSLLIQALRYSDPDLAMPPDAALPPQIIADFEQWIARGAPDPRESPTARVATVRGTSSDEGSPGGALPPQRPGAGDGAEYPSWSGMDPSAHWSFKPILRPSVPTVNDKDWPRNDIDRFILSGLEAKGIAPVGDADRRTLLRRLSYDLTGLPPSPDALDAFERDARPNALEKAVDALLADPAFGERWGRHWLDVARYAESSGKENNVLYPHAYRYRDFVVRAFNRDTPFDEFIIEQLAGDVLPWQDKEDRAWKLMATGYLAVGSKGHNTRGRQQFALDLADEQLDAVTQGVMALTVACARCHDHKFDPIPQREYYAMAGIFLSSKTNFGSVRGPGNQHASDLVILPSSADVPPGGTMGPAQRALLKAARDRATREAEQIGDRTELQRRARSGDERARLLAVRLQRFESTALTAKEALDRFDATGEPTEVNFVAMGMTEGRPIDARLLDRGELDRAGEQVPRGVVSALGVEMPSISEGSGRLELAQWLVSPQHPLTARVMANRIWLHLFGKPIVPTPDNFGMAGLPPTNAALLDHLASRFIELDWSVKALIREIVLSRAYGLSTASKAPNLTTDPENALLWRMNGKRLEAECIRDAMLAASGRLDRTPMSGSLVNGLEGDLRNPGIAAMLEQPMPPKRSIYLPVVRDHVPHALEVFDYPDASFVTGQREQTSVPTQALLLLNDAEVGASARALAERLVASKSTDTERVTLAFQLLFGRRATASEQQAVKDFLRSFAAAQTDGTNESSNRAATALRRGHRGGRGAKGGGPASAQWASHALLGTSSVDAWTAACRALFASAEFRTVH